MSFLFWVLLAAATDQQTPPPATDSKPETTQPSLELLEFLGGFETIDGDWIDPMSFEEQYERDTKAQDDETEKNETSSQNPDPDPARLH